MRIYWYIDAINAVFFNPLNSSNPLMADHYEDYTREQLMRLLRERDKRWAQIKQ
jgi:hypothetical protein